MATVVNNPQPAQQQPNNNSGSGFLIGIILIILVIILLFYFGLPYLNTGGGGTQVNVPEQVDVNVQQPQQPQQ